MVNTLPGHVPLFLAIRNFKLISDFLYVRGLIRVTIATLCHKSSLIRTGFLIIAVEDDSMPPRQGIWNVLTTSQTWPSICSQVTWFFAMWRVVGWMYCFTCPSARRMLRALSMNRLDMHSPGCSGEHCLWQGDLVKQGKTQEESIRWQWWPEQKTRWKGKTSPHYIYIL